MNAAGDANPPNTERRNGERRHAERRAAGRRRSDGPPSSNFGNTDSGTTDPYFDPGWLAAGETPEGKPSPQRPARPDRPDRARPSEPDSALHGVYRTYAAARAVIGLGLVGVQGVGGLLGMRNSDALALVSMLYAVQAVVLWLLPRFDRLAQGLPPQGTRRGLWLATVGFDLLVFSLLHGLEASSSFNYGALLVLPVLMAGVLSNRLRALGTAAAVALILLVITWRTAAGSADAPAQMLQTGLAGLGLFTISLLAGELASRLAREEVAARDSLELARQQAQLNRLVIEEMADGVLVVDRNLNVRAANPAARALLVDEGLCVPAPFPLHHLPAWMALHHEVERALQEGSWPEAGSDVTLEFEGGLTRTLRLRVRFMRGRKPARRPDEAASSSAFEEPSAVLLLEDARTLEARIRQEKLAAMGRVSAGIAHEIRNPLMAISQANDLMMEDPLSAPQQRLAQMVADNVQRLKRLVDDVMELAPGRLPDLQTIDAAALVSQATVDWARTAAPGMAEQRLQAQLPNAPLGVVFDPEHLRRVLVNLLDNAHRHASPASGAISLRLAALDEGWAQLSVQSDGPAITPEIERYLFEPFFSTRSRGSGLGLYICRELCERYGAHIDFHLRPGSERLRNEFTVSMRRAAWTGSNTLMPLVAN